MHSNDLDEIIKIIQEYQRTCFLKTVDSVNISLWAGLITTIAAYCIQLFHMHVDLIWVSIGYGMLGSMIMSIITGYKHPTEQKVSYESVKLIAKHDIKNIGGFNKLQQIVNSNKELTLRDLQLFGMEEIQCRIIKN